MSCYDDVVKIGKKLSKMVKEGTSVRILIADEFSVQISSAGCI